MILEDSMDKRDPLYDFGNCGSGIGHGEPTGVTCHYF
jgi:hypothetical protein